MYEIIATTLLYIDIMAEITTNVNMGSLSPILTMPDLSHLTDEERLIIESVMQRQKKEEEEEAQVLK